MHGIFETEANSLWVLKAKHAFSNQVCEQWMGSRHRWSEGVNDLDSLCKNYLQIIFQSVLRAEML